jgi:hypothetical protein
MEPADSNVINLHPQTPIVPGADMAVIRLLEAWTARARAGEISCVAVAVILTTGGSTSNWAGRAFGHDLIGATAGLHARTSAEYVRVIGDAMKEPGV